MVNRIGLHHFGRDLVPTRGNFFSTERGSDASGIAELARR